MIYTLNTTNRHIKGTIELTGSKSISNRALIIRALCPDHFQIDKLAQAKDTELMCALLDSQEEELDAGPAGTTFRFLTALLSLQKENRILTGSERMKQRPIGVLVNALRTLGAQIDYLEKEGYPPLRIGSLDPEKASDQLEISAGTSSQYISALLMIAPTLPKGLHLRLKGKIVSRPYIEMTLNLMQYFGVNHQWEGDTITVPPQTYHARPFTVEADWSAASYYYALAAFADEADLQLNGLFSESVQGDAVLAEMMTQLGVHTHFNESGIRLTKSKQTPPDTFSWDFIRCPDLAQTLAVICAGLGVKGVFTGLETLRIKETDRIAALQNELGKVEAGLQLLEENAVNAEKEYFQTIGPVKLDTIPTFDTYEDHRMAMAFAPLSLFGPIRVADPEVVEKSYPDYWNDLESLGVAFEEEK